MDISVIVPVYGTEHYIEKCLKSLFTQSKVDDVEFILINDCTNDRSFEIARDISKQFSTLDIKLIELSENKGQAIARQHGFEQSRGQYILNLDSDDWFESNMLEEMFQKASTYCADIVICDFYIEFENKSIYSKQNAAETSHGCIKQFISSDMHGMLLNKLIKREILLNNNIRFVAHINLWEDLIYNIKVFYYSSTVSKINKAFLHYRQNTTSTTASISQKNEENMIAAIDEIESFLQGKNVINDYKEEIITRKISTLYLLFNSSSHSNRLKYRTLYQDVHPHISTLGKLNAIHKIALNQAISGNFFIFDFIQKLLKIKRLIFKKKKYSPTS